MLAAGGVEDQQQIDDENHDREFESNDESDDAALAPGGAGDGTNRPGKRPAKDPHSFGKCQVCGLDANGVHYGVESCEGCKGFYRRSVQIHAKLKCKTNGACFGIVPLKCRRCRFQRCLQLGMKFNSTRMGRIPKHIKTHAQPAPICRSDSFEQPHGGVANDFLPLVSSTKSTVAASGRLRFVPVSACSPRSVQPFDDDDVDAAVRNDNIAALAADRALLAVASSLTGQAVVQQAVYPPLHSAPVEMLDDRARNQPSFLYYGAEGFSNSSMVEAYDTAARNDCEFTVHTNANQARLPYLPHRGHTLQMPAHVPVSPTVSSLPGPPQESSTQAVLDLNSTTQFPESFISSSSRSTPYAATLSSLAASLTSTDTVAKNRGLTLSAEIRRMIEASIATSSAKQYSTLDYTAKVTTTRSESTAGIAAISTGEPHLPQIATDLAAQMLPHSTRDACVGSAGTSSLNDETSSGGKQLHAENIGTASGSSDSMSEPLRNNVSHSHIGFDHLSIADSESTPDSFDRQRSQQTSSDEIYSRRSAAVLSRSTGAVTLTPRAISLNADVFNGRLQQAPLPVPAQFTVGSESPSSLVATTPIDSSTMDKVYDGVLAFLRESATAVIQDPLRVYAYVVVDARERMLFLPLFNQTIIINLFTPEGTAELHKTTRDVGWLSNLVDPLRLAWTTLLLGLRYAARKYYVNKLFLDCLQAGLPLRKWQQRPSDLNEGVCVVAAHFCQRMADFVDALPGVCQLPADDRRILTRSSMVLGWASVKALMFDRNDCYLLLGNGARYNLEWMEYLIGPDVAGILCRICSDMKSMQLTFAEMCLFTSLMVLYEKQTGVTAPDAVVQLRQHYWRALQHLVQSTSPSKEQARRKLDHVQHCLQYCDELCNICLPRIESYSFDRPFGRREVPQVESEQFIDIVEKGPV